MCVRSNQRRSTSANTYAVLPSEMRWCCFAQRQRVGYNKHYVDSLFYLESIIFFFFFSIKF